VSSNMPTAGFGTATLTPQTASDLISNISEATQQFGQAKAATDQATGDTAEVGAYNTAGSIAGANARLAQVSGGIQQYQEGVQVQKTLGTQKATQASNGFGASGSALDILRSSTQQGLLQQQTTGVNADLQAGGFEQQGAASAAEATAAQTAATSSTDTAATDTAIATTTKTNAANEASALGLNIPGISNISATSMPAINPAGLGVQAKTAPQMIGGSLHGPNNPFII